MRWQNQQPCAVHVDEGHHDQLIGCKLRRFTIEHNLSRGALPRDARCPSPSRSPFIAIIQGRFVAMMSIGDEELFVPHLAADQLNQRRVRDFPDTVLDAILILHVDIWRSAAAQQVVNFTSIAVEHKELPEMRPGGSQQLQPVGFWLSQGLFVPEDHPGGIIFNFPQGDETTALILGQCARRGETLRIGIERRLRIFEENALAPPIPKKACGPGVDVVAFAAGLAFAKHDAYQVIGAGRVVAFLHLRSNLVVGLCNRLRNLDPERVITQGAKRCEISHDFSKASIVARTNRHLPCRACVQPEMQFFTYFVENLGLEKGWNSVLNPVLLTRTSEAFMARLGGCGSSRPKLEIPRIPLTPSRTWNERQLS